jgi:hypothetical protein
MSRPKMSSDFSWYASIFKKMSDFADLVIVIQGPGDRSASLSILCKAQHFSSLPSILLSSTGSAYMDLLYHVGNHLVQSFLLHRFCLGIGLAVRGKIRTTWCFLRQRLCRAYGGICHQHVERLRHDHRSLWSRMESQTEARRVKLGLFVTFVTGAL